jgi:large subunit ribosomal protein L3
MNPASTCRYVLSLDGCQVTGHRTRERDGYVAIQLGAGARKAKNTSQAERGHFAKALVEPKRHRRRVPRRDEGLIDVGAEITADHYVEGQRVDIQGETIGKGFAGRHEALELRRHARHPRRVGLHRAHGSTGQRQDPGKVFKGRRWPAT